MKNAFVVNIGDELQRWTNDIYLSTKHRVVITNQNNNHNSNQNSNQNSNENTNSNTDRYSIAFFWEPNFDCEIKCLPGLCNETNPAKYDTVLHGNHLLYKFTKSYQRNKESSDFQTNEKYEL